MAPKKPQPPTTPSRVARLEAIILLLDERVTALERRPVAPPPTRVTPTPAAPPAPSAPAAPPILKPASERRPGDPGWPPTPEEHLDEVRKAGFHP